MSRTAPPSRPQRKDQGSSLRGSTGAPGGSVPPLQLGRRERRAPRGPEPGRRVPPRLCGAQLAAQNGSRRPPGRPREAENDGQDPPGVEFEGASGSPAPAHSPAAQTGMEHRLQRARDAEKQPRRRLAGRPASGEEGAGGGVVRGGRGCLSGSAGGHLWPWAARRGEGQQAHFPLRDGRVSARSP